MRDPIGPRGHGMCLTLQEKSCAPLFCSIIFLFLHILNLKNPPTINITYCTLLSVVIGRLDLRETGKRGKPRDNARYLFSESNALGLGSDSTDNTHSVTIHFLCRLHAVDQLVFHHHQHQHHLRGQAPQPLPPHAQHCAVVASCTAPYTCPCWIDFYQEKMHSSEEPNTSTGKGTALR